MRCLAVSRTLAPSPSTRGVPRRRGAAASAASAKRGKEGRRSENVQGDLYVDGTCIDCDTCRWMAPHTFDRVGGFSAVVAQPDNEAARMRALQAAVACPTGSIRTERPAPEMRDVVQSFPVRLQQATELGLEVYHCGFHSESSYGATSYLLCDREAGVNILVDSPRYHSKLAARLEELGGVDYLYLTHIDDVADHVKFAARFGAHRILHRLEANPRRSPEIDRCETLLEGRGPWTPIPELPHATVYFQPGHTRGHTVLVYKGVVFTGDHLGKQRQTGMLDAGIHVCWYSMEELATSIEYLSDAVGDTLKLVLPGHWRSHRSDDMRADLDAAARRVRGCL